MTIDRSARNRLVAAAAFLLMAALFAMVGRWGTQANVDVIATDAPAWQLANQQTLEVDFLEGFNPWVVSDKDDRPVSNRAPGLIGTAYPAYAITQPRSFTNAPGTATALLMTLGAIYVVYRLLHRDFDQRFALGCALVLALGTTTWTVSASQLWPHGPGQLWMALGLYGAATARYAISGGAFAFAIITRPITAVAAAVVGLRQSWVERDLMPAAKIGFLSLAGVLALAAYNRWLFGSPSISGAESAPVVSRTLETYAVSDYVTNVFQMLVGLPNGFLLFSPVIAVAGFGAVKVWRSIPDWALSAGLAAPAYLLVHAAVNRASGGMEIFYRYPLEAIVLATPALAWGARHLWSTGGTPRRVLLYSAIYSVALQVVNALYINCRSVFDFPSLCRLVS